MEKQVSYSTSNSYSTLNELGPKTKYVWFVFHGIGYLSRYFLKYFDTLDPEVHYIVAPQAPSKYYLNGQYMHVGASWLTKENTMEGVANVVRYLDEVFKAEEIPSDCKLIVLGFSQGVSIAARWVARSNISCDQLVLYAGGLPKELTADDFASLPAHTRIIMLVGNRDEYLSPKRLEQERAKSEILFGGRAEELIFEGGHEVKKDIIHQLVV